MALQFTYRYTAVVAADKYEPVAAASGSSEHPSRRYDRTRMRRLRSDAARVRRARSAENGLRVTLCLCLIRLGFPSEIARGVVLLVFPDGTREAPVEIFPDGTREAPIEL